MYIYIIIGVLILIIAYILFQYNSFIKSRNIVKEAFSTMDVYLKKRWDLIPNIVETVKGYMKYESNVIEHVTKLRNISYDGLSLKDKINTNEQVATGLSQIMAVSENYPDLKASQNFLDLSRQLSKIEDEIANSRKYYNGAVRIFNNKIQIFPNNIIAKIFGFHSENMFEADMNEKNNVKVDV